MGGRPRSRWHLRDASVQKREDALLDKIGELMRENEQLRKDLIVAVEAALSVRA